eukprot:scaffold435_cov342-Pavlova_lutheri.AAC.38
MAVMGNPSFFSLSIRIFFRATSSLVSASTALYTCPYVPSPTCSCLSNRSTLLAPHLERVRDAIARGIPSANASIHPSLPLLQGRKMGSAVAGDEVVPHQPGPLEEGVGGGGTHVGVSATLQGA